MFTLIKQFPITVYKVSWQKNLRAVLTEEGTLMEWSI